MLGSAHLAEQARQRVDVLEFRQVPEEVTEILRGGTIDEASGVLNEFGLDLLVGQRI